MDFDLNEDEAALQDGIRSFCAGRFDMETVRSLEASAGVDRGRWRELADTGVFGLRLPEADGGVGLGMTEAVLVFEELGRAVVPGPILATHLASGLVDGAVTGERVIGLVERPAHPILVEHLDALDALASSTSPDGWVKSHKVLLAELGPAQKSHVWERVKARKEELAAAPPEEPPPDGTTTPSKARKGTTTTEGSAVASTGTGGAPKATARGPVVLPDWAFSRDAIRVHAASDWSCKPHAENSVRLWGAFVPGLAEVASSWLQARGYDEATADGMTAVWSKEGPRPRTVKATRKGRKAA